MMDSANSGSIQSSSGGDDDFDSRADSLFAFIHSSARATETGGAAFQPPVPSSSHNLQHHHFLESFSYLDHPPTILPLDSNATTTATANNDCLWPRPIRCTTDFTPSSSSPNALSSSRMVPQNIAQAPVQLPDQSIATAPTAAAPRSSKKRSRASRRAPTTVLTTDTSNFRAMVQEFTGIPSPPFATAGSPSLFARSRFDLFGSAASAFSSSSDPLPPPFLLRPFAQKVVQGPTFAATNAAASISSSSPSSYTNTSLTSIVTNGTIAYANANAANILIPVTTGDGITSTNSNNYQPPPRDVGLASQSQFLFNIENPVFSFQSLHHPQHHVKYSLPTMPVALNAKSHMVASAAHSFTSKNLDFPPGPISSEGGMPSTWAGASVTEGGNDQGQLRPIAGDHNIGSLQRGSSCKLNFSASGSSDFNSDKGSESVAASRGEGMLNSWVCSSD